MIMPPRLRKFALVAHVAISVGWLGAVVVFLALAIVGMTAREPLLVRGAYVAMEAAAWSVLVPLALGSLVTGVIEGLDTTWGLFQHYWVLIKLVLTVFSTVILFMYMETFHVMARVARNPSADLRVVQDPSPALHSTLAIVVLLVTTVLAIYKPRGLTPYGRRYQRETKTGGEGTMAAETTGTRQGDTVMAARNSASGAREFVSGRSRRAGPGPPRWTYVAGTLLMILIALVFLVIVLHVVGGGFPGH
jgi:hypothetical protein